MNHLNLKKNLSKGFSLVEMLVVIAVIGVIAAIAIPSIGSINQSAKDATNQRNAQSIMSVYESGVAAGATWGAPADNVALITAVVAGTIGTGPFAGTNFGVPGMSAADQTACKTYISAAPPFAYLAP